MLRLLSWRVYRGLASLTKCARSIDGKLWASGNESLWSRPSGVGGMENDRDRARPATLPDGRPACFEDEKASASLKIGAAISSIADEMREEHRRRVLGE